MSRNRFDMMRSYFHIIDNSTMKAHDDPEYGKFKMRPFEDSIKSSFQELEVEENKSVDELSIHRHHCSQRRITKCKTLIIFQSEIVRALLRAGKWASRQKISLHLNL